MQPGKHRQDQLPGFCGFLEPDEIWMSDLRRVIQTVDIVCPKIYPRKAFKRIFRRWISGQWEGLTYDEIRQTYPKDLARWSDDWRHGGADRRGMF